MKVFFISYFRIIDLLENGLHFNINLLCTVIVNGIEITLTWGIPCGINRFVFASFFSGNFFKKLDRFVFLSCQSNLGEL